jgi:hypothetical protein
VAQAQTVLFKGPVRTALEKLFISVIKTNLFMLYEEDIAVCSHINTKHINTGWAERTVEC